MLFLFSEKKKEKELFGMLKWTHIIFVSYNYIYVMYLLQYYSSFIENCPSRLKHQDIRKELTTFSHKIIKTIVSHITLKSVSSKT